MVALTKILKGIDYTLVSGTLDKSVRTIAFDSRQLTEDSIFVAIKGTQQDGHDFIEQAISRGAEIIIAEREIIVNKNVTFLKVKNSAETLGVLASNFYDNPSQKIKLIGVTGTNGKTTTVSLLHALYSNLSYKAGLLSTIGNRILDANFAATHTTPDALSINSLLDQMLKNGCTHCFMEVSSHAITQKRIHGLRFSGAVFTNITHDHLDYHSSFREYLDAKKVFFDLLDNDAFAVMNADDKHSGYMVQNSKACIRTYALKTVSYFKGKILENSFAGLKLLIDGNEFHTEKVGAFNAYNLMSVYTVAVMDGLSKDDVLKAMSVPASVEGRFDLIRKSENYLAIVDYAHTPDALKNVISTINEIKKTGMSLITVFGCGGNRDKTKRPEMGKIAANLSDQVIVTSDNPRFEDVLQIIGDIEKGIEEGKKANILVIPDREMAIKTACTLAKAGDVVLVAGKGHEKYQEINGARYPFDDKEIVLKYIKE